MDINTIRENIKWTQRYLNLLQREHKAETGRRFNINVPYQFSFWFEEIFEIRFNYSPGCKGDAWTPDDPEEVEVVEILLAGEPLSVDQHNTFVDWYGEDLTEQCWEEFTRWKEKMI